MIEKWTIDSLADEIEPQFMHADPHRKLVRRFFTEGKRHGRKGMPSERTRRFLERAIAVAAERIAQEYIETKVPLEMRVAGIGARIESLQARCNRLTELDAEDGRPHDGGDAGHGGEPDAPAPTSPGDPTSALEVAEAARRGTLRRAAPVPDMSSALDRAREARARRTAEREREEVEERRKLRAVERDRIETEIRDLHVELGVTVRQIEELPRPYVQRVASCHAAGEVMWARFRSGHRARSRPTDGNGDIEEPAAELEVRWPPALAAHRAAEGGHRGPT